jgi:hypothetical protein
MTNEELCVLETLLDSLEDNGVSFDDLLDALLSETDSN